MKKLLVCLANSRKQRGRCLAGIEVQLRGDDFEVVREGGHPVWIRPVSTSPHGELPTRTVEAFHLLDVLEVECAAPVPVGAQVENWLFESNSLKKVGEFPNDVAHLNLLLSSDRGGLFGNHGKAVHSDHIGEVDHSLLFLRAHEPTSHVQKNAKGNDQIRIHFVSNGMQYDLAVTDPAAENLLPSTPEVLREADAVYVTVSLGLEYQSFYSKLIAGVIYC
jgi:hypothetical protein